MSGAAREQKLAFWTRHLAGAPAVLTLPLDHERRRQSSFRGSTEHFVCDPDLARAIQTRVRAEQTTLFAWFLTAFHIFLYRCSDQNDVVVGTPVANRNQRMAEPLIGFFVNTLGLRGRFGPASAAEGRPVKVSFASCLSRLKNLLPDIYANQDLPFELLVEALQPPRDLAVSPVFQVMFSLQHEEPGLGASSLGSESPGSDKSAGFPDLQTEVWDISNDSAPFDLSVNLTATGTGLVGSFRYNRDLFERTTIQRFMVHFQRLLHAVLEHSNRPVADLPMLSAEDLQRLDQVNPAADQAVAEPLHRRIAAIAAQQPEAVAVTAGNRHLSRTALERQAAALAVALAQRGVGAEMSVGLLAGTTAARLCGLLGILKSGAAYVPMDPEFPAERLNAMIEDSGLRCLVCDRTAAAKAETLRGIASIMVIDDADAPDEGDASGPTLPAEGLAYIIYTSGSTGKPKGVAVTQGALANFAAAMTLLPGMHAGARLLAVTTLCFDIAALELLLPPAVGGTVCLADREDVRDGHLLTAALDRQATTVIQATPATWRLLLNSGWRGRSNLHLYCGGEALTRDLAAELLPLGASLHNLYGPTETTAWSSTTQLVDPLPARIPIGRPLRNTRFYMVSAQLQRQPFGVQGELCISGTGLARGYFGRPDLTAARFVPDPFATSPGRRLYRTGDLVVMNADHSIAFLGRNNQQIKLRGYRIDLGEIETRLCRHDAIAQAVVEAHPEAGGTRHLIAYLVARKPAPGDSATPAATPSNDTLRRYLSRFLPTYMMPACFVYLDELPLAHNGKLQRNRLPQPQPGESDGQVFNPPATPTEAVVAGMFAEVFGLPRVSAHDQFFNLGGHSLNAFQVMNRLKEAFYLEITARELFLYPVVRDLAAHIDQLRHNRPQATELRRFQTERPAILPLSYAHQDLPFEMLVEALNPPRDLRYTPIFQVVFNLTNMPESALELPGCDVEELADPNDAAKYDLTLAMVEQGDRLLGSFRYKIELFDAATVARMADHLGTLMQALVDDSRRPVDTLSLLGPSERNHILQQLSGGGQTVPAATTLHGLLEAVAAQQPDAAALQAEDRLLTYDALNRRAERIAQALRRRGIGAEQVVALLTDRDQERFAAMLGIWKAGAAYVALTPGDPPQRDNFLLTDSGAVLLLSAGRNQPPEEVDGKPAVRVSRLLKGTLPHTETLPRVDPAGLAYIAYTSGSTGRAKGIMGRHAGAAGHLRFLAETYGFSRHERALQHTPPCATAGCPSAAAPWR